MDSAVLRGAVIILLDLVLEDFPEDTHDVSNYPANFTTIIYIYLNLKALLAYSPNIRELALVILLQRQQAYFARHQQGILWTTR
ncbi:hypothetical protein E2C01_056803 [Portunus trituberculatus]|uniref:Uncharacterized protein n=1 Tax=Portunus trituberculatus TaxID=210409 RepID=A0A5B7H1L7_PORTR|nr:hypothetical protein [Portunus trituberculatus]